MTRSDMAGKFVAPTALTWHRPYGDDLIWFGWMDERIDEDEDTMRDIAGPDRDGIRPALVRATTPRDRSRCFIVAPPSPEPRGEQP